MVDSTDGMALFYTPKGETIEDIVHHLKPEGKQLLSVAAYGYPLVFLAEGAESVLSFDISKGAITWNNILSALIKRFPFKFNRRLFTEIQSTNELDSTSGDISDAFPDEECFFAHDYLRRWQHIAYHSSPEEIERIYPHTRDEKTFNRVKQKIVDGKWEIVESDLLGLLKSRRRIAPWTKFDGAYISNIQEWVAKTDGFSGEGDGIDLDKFQREYGVPLGNLVGYFLRQGGIVYEASFHKMGDPCRIHPNDWSLFDSGEYQSSNPNSKSTIIVSTKKTRN
jgi:hypothetical protein